MTRIVIALVFTLTSQLFESPVYAQTSDSALMNNLQVWERHARNSAPGFFVDIDKQVYQPTENIFFTAYLSDKGGDTLEPHDCYVLLRDLTQDRVLANDRFVMKYGISTGNLLIPDSVPSGEYLVMAYLSNIFGADSLVSFQRRITIKSLKKPPFQLAVTTANSRFPTGDSVPLHFRVMTDYGGLASKGTITYLVLSEGKLLQAGKAVIDAFGESSAKLPSVDTAWGTVYLYTTISRNDQVSHSRIPLCLTPHRIDVRQYPEGGALIDGRLTRVGIQLRQKGNLGLKTSGRLFEDGVPVAQFTTDEYGLGTYSFTPHLGKRYEIGIDRIPADGYLSGTFPAIQKDGYSLAVTGTGVVRDSLNIRLISPQRLDPCSLIIYSDKDILYAAVLHPHEKLADLTIPTGNWPRGLSYISLLDDDGNALAERSIYVEGQNLKVQIQTDSAVYHSNARVQVWVTISDENGQGVPGIFSLSSVLSSRISEVNYPDIVRETSIKAGSSQMIDEIPPACYFDEDSAMCTLLLTRLSAFDHWAKIKTDKLRYFGNQAEDYGYVLDGQAPVKKPIPLLIMGAGSKTILTDKSGYFTIPYSCLFANAGEKPFIAVVGDQKDNRDTSYILNIENAYDSLNARLSRSWYRMNPYVSDREIIEDTSNNQSFNVVKSLKGIVINAGNEDNYKEEGACKDYVCLNHVLNCGIHPFGGIKPVIGHLYYFARPGVSGPRMIVYKGCLDGFSPSLSAGRVTPIHQPREIYRSDTTNFSTDHPMIATTVYWAPVVKTDSNGVASFSFCTNEMKGRLYCILQGYSAQGPISGKAIIRVIP